ncbi:MAG: response regulator [Leadbetterella sp.]|nr:response regulator [Leadbetterella sp.]
MSVRLYIVEDEPLIVATIEMALKKSGYAIVGDADNAADALREINLFQPDLVLIDIRLDSEESGIEVARELDKSKIPYFYLTSQTDPATLAEVKNTNPLGYIVKPFTEPGLRSSVEVGWSNYARSKPEYLVFTSGGVKHRLNQEQILYLKAFDNYCYVFTETGQYLVPKTLKHLSGALNPEKFCKIHRSCWVNVSRITSVGNTTVRLGETEVPLARNFKEKVRELIMENG